MLGGTLCLVGICGSGFVRTYPSGRIPTSSRRKPRRLPQPWSSGARNVVGIAYPLTARAAGRGGRESHLRESNRSPLRGTSLPPRRQRASCRDDFVPPPPRCPMPPSRLAAAAPAMCRGEDSPLAMKRSIRTASTSSGGGVRCHLLLYNSANRPTHQFCSCATDFTVTQIIDN